MLLLSISKIAGAAKMKFSNSEITLLIFFTSENNTFLNMHDISSIFFCVLLICI